MDEELRAFLTAQFDELRRENAQRFAAIDERFTDLRRELTEHMEEVRDQLGDRIEEVRRQLGVVVEQQQDQIRLIAEGHATLREHMDTKFAEQEGEHRETRAAMKLSFAELDRRITRLEMLVVDLEARLNRLEQGG